MPVLGAGGTSRDLLFSYVMERARRGTKMKPGKDPVESRFEAFISETRTVREMSTTEKAKGTTEPLRALQAET